MTGRHFRHGLFTDICTAAAALVASVGAVTLAVQMLLM